MPSSTPKRRSRRIPEPWEAYINSFSLPDYHNATAGQLQQQSLPWQATGLLPQATVTDPDAELSSEEEEDFTMTQEIESGGMEQEAVEEIDAEVEPATASLIRSLPQLPQDFQPLSGQHHKRQWRLPHDFATGSRIDPPNKCTDRCCYGSIGDNCAAGGVDPGVLIQDRWDLPLLFFQTFFTREVFEIMAANTNVYAASKNAGLPEEGYTSRRPWQETSAPELIIWFDQIIYMSVVRLTRLEKYWSKRGEWPVHCISRFRGHNRFAQIKSFFHLSPPTNSRLPATRFFEKVEPIASILMANFQSVITPATSVSIDEIIVRFTSRSKHTIMMRGKPCPVGYNVLALCEAGYLYDFIFSSPKTGYSGVPANPTEGVISTTNPSDPFITAMIMDLKKTSRAVLFLMLQLPRHLFFSLYCDNLFSNTDLFHILRYFGISAYDTARSNSKNWPQIFRDKIKRKTTRLPFNHQTAVVVHNDVCAVVWQDKNLVQFITTHHDPRHQSLVDRKRPSAHNNSKWFKEMVATVWGDESIRSLLLPNYSIDYNNNMGGVDRHDQMRSYAPTQLISVRGWYPIFFMLLDAAVINAFLACRDLYGYTRLKQLGRQRDFRMRLI